MKQCKDILEMENLSLNDILYELRINFYPECEIISVSDYIKGDRKYEWYANIVFTYFGDTYLVDLDCIGNGGWLGVDNHKVSTILKVKPKVTLVEKIEYYVI